MTRFVQVSAAALAALLALAGCGGTPEAELAPLARPAKETPYHVSISDTFSCGDFEVAFSSEFRGVVTTFFDREGVPVRIHTRERFLGTLTNLDTGYTVTDGRDAYHFFDDLVDESSSVVGLFFMVRDPDGKKVAIDVGNITFSPDGVTIAGPHDVFETGLCIYLDR